MNVGNVMNYIGIPFVGMMWFRIAAPGIVRHVENARIGENGIAKIVTNVLMELVYPVNDAKNLTLYHESFTTNTPHNRHYHAC